MKELYILDSKKNHIFKVIKMDEYWNWLIHNYMKAKIKQERKREIRYIDLS